MTTEATRPWVIDGDGHVREPFEMFDTYLPPEFVGYGRELYRRWQTDNEFDLPGYRKDPHAIKGGSDPAARLVDMDTDLIERAVLYPTLGLLIQGIQERKPAVAMARAVNDWMADYCSHAPDRLLGVGVLPCVNADDALAEAQRCIDELGFAGVYRRPEATGDILTVHDPAFEPLWEFLQDRDVPIAIHSGYNSQARQPYFLERFGRNYIPGHCASFVVEAMNALSSFVFFGILDRYPDLRVGLVECGAVWAMAYCHRMDEHMKYWPASVPLSLEPSELFRRQVYVSVEEYEPGLNAMMELYPDNVLFESDYPHPDCTFPGATEDLLEAEQLTDGQRRAILRDNSLRLYGLDEYARSATAAR
jgi:predicted TIM-barrel fold metal-dependent hydrolase